MNAERAETYLRLLAEAETREPAAPLFPVPWSGGMIAGITCRKLQAVAQALTTVDALDQGTAEVILTDFDLAVSARHLHRGRQWRPGRRAAPVNQASVIQAVAATTQIRTKSPTAAGAQGSGRPGEPRELKGPERFIPLGMTIPFRAWGMSGGLYLMSYAHTAAGARLTVAWRAHGSSGLEAPSLEHCTVTDDRGGRYRLDFTGTSSGPAWTAVLSLDPDPPGDLRWIDIGSPGGTAVRIGLASPGPAGAAAEVSEAGLDPGEHLLTLIAERLLHDLRLCRAGLQQEPPGRFTSLAAGLGEVVAALEAAEILAPDSPVPGRLATLCANLRIDDPELTARAAADLPEQWLSLLAHYLRRKPVNAPARDDVAAAVAAPLPGPDGVRLALLGLHNAEKTTFLHLLASGLPGDSRPGPFGIEMYFPLSVWVRDDGGRWHLGRPDGLHRIGGEDVLRLRLTPPLTRPTTWIEVLAAGRSVQVRAKLPLRWENPL